MCLSVGMGGKVFGKGMGRGRGVEGWVRMDGWGVCIVGLLRLV